MLHCRTMIREMINRWIIIRLLVVSVFSLALTFASLNPCPNAYAQQLETRNSKLETGIGTEGVWKTYRSVDGLADNSVYSIIQDKEGTMWFGTSSGVSRFDGKNWKTYTRENGLADNSLVWGDIMQDKEGAIWFGTYDSGVSSFDGKSWKTYTKEDGFDTTQPKGLANNSVYSIVQDKEGVIWFGTYGGGVSRFDGKSWKTYTQKDGLADNKVWDAIIQDKEGVVWFGTSNGVSRFDGKSWKTYTKKDGLTDNIITSIMQDSDGKIWVGTWNGVSSFDGKSWKTYTKKDGLAGNRITAIMQDKEGIIWVGTSWRDGGVSKFDGKSWKTYTQKDGLTNNLVFAITQDKEGAIWVGTGDGVSRFDGKSWKTYTQKDGLANNIVSAIIQDKKGAIWFGTRGGVSKFDEVSWKTYTQKDGLAHKYVEAIMQDKEGAIWFGTYGGGVSRFDGKSWKTYTQKDGLADNEVIAIIQDKEGTMWFGTWGGGVSRFDGKSWKTYTQKDGLASNEVLSIMQDKEGAIWFGTRGGVSKFDGVSWKTYTQKDGLADNQVRAIIQDKEGTIWFGTANGGVSRFDGKCFQTIDSRDGLTNDLVPCVYADKSGQIWIGTESGVVQFAPNKVPLPVYITQVLADEKTFLRPHEPLALPAGVRRVALDFHAISFKTRPGAMKYFYQLVGKDSDWQGPANNDTAEYFNLKPGKYSFKVQAVDRDLNYSEIASLQMVLPPLWYQKGWVRGILAGGGLAFLFAFGFVTWHFWANRIARKQLEGQLQEQKTREAQLQMLRYQLNPHFLFNALNSITALINQNTNHAKMMIAELSEYLRYSLLKKNDSEAALRDEIESIRNYLVIEKIRFEENLEVDFDIKKSAEEYRLPVFIIQPLVENAIKYGMRTSPMPLKIQIEAHMVNDSLHLEILNTGKWTQPAENNVNRRTGTSTGLRNVQDRLNYAYPGRHQFEIFEKDGWVHAVIAISN